MCARIARAGFDVTAFDVRPEVVAAAAARRGPPGRQRGRMRAGRGRAHHDEPLGVAVLDAPVADALRA